MSDKLHRPRAGLDKTTVVRAAAELLNAGGAEALTLARLAQKLGVQTPSLYNHVAGLPGLQRELALLNTRLLGERLEKAAIARSGPEALWEIAQAYRAFIKENPGLYLASLRAAGNPAPPESAGLPKDGPPGLRGGGVPSAPTVDGELQVAEDQVVAIVLAVVASFGLSGEEALHAVRGLRSAVHGFATLEIAGGFGLALDRDESFRRLVEAFSRGLGQQTRPAQR